MSEKTYCPPPQDWPMFTDPMLDADYVAQVRDGVEYVAICRRRHMLTSQLLDRLAWEQDITRHI